VPLMEELKKEMIEARVEAIRERLKSKALEAKVKKLEQEVLRLRQSPGLPQPATPDAPSLTPFVSPSPPTASTKRTPSKSAEDTPNKRKKGESRKVLTVEMSILMNQAHLLVLIDSRIFTTCITNHENSRCFLN
jgi:hypothetical protein